jgi:hypothetical protein
MDIQTKFGIGQQVYILWNDAVKRAPVTSIRISVTEDNLHIFYTKIVYTVLGSEQDEKKVFGTIEELLDYLKQSVKA